MSNCQTGASFLLFSHAKYYLFIVVQAVTTAVGTFCFPIDSVKRRLMVQRKIKPTVSTPSNTLNNISDSVIKDAPIAKVHIPYKNGLDCATRIIREEGVKGLFAGLSVNLVRGFTGAVLLVAYDDLKKRL